MDSHVYFHFVSFIMNIEDFFFLPWNNMMNICCRCVNNSHYFPPYAIIINKNTVNSIQRIIFRHFISFNEQLKANDYFSSKSSSCCQWELSFHSIFQAFWFINHLKSVESFQINILNASISGSFSFVFIEYMCQITE